MGVSSIPQNTDILPTIHVISDSVGLTAQTVARAAAAQFGVSDPVMEVLPWVRSFEDIKAYIDEKSAWCRERTNDGRMLILYTLVDATLSRQMSEYAMMRDDIVAIDLMTGAVGAIANMTGLAPSTKPGGVYVADQNYFRRIEAIEFTIEHDDGRNPQDLDQADIVLLGVSRSSKTPTSIYLAQQGYKVANVPLDPSTEPPSQIYDVKSMRLFGLMTTADVLIDIRQRRLGKASAVASRYADPEYVYQDLEKARALMRRLGCIVIHTEKRAVEETAQEILRYYERAHAASVNISG